MLTFDGLGKRFPGQPRPAIADLDLEVHDGEILGLVGLNGAGKTTTIRIGVGANLPSLGRVLVDGLDVVREKRRASARVGWVPEGFPFEMNARALSLLVYYAGFYGIRGREGRRRCGELLARVGLASVATHRLRTYSFGMKKRFALASAMVGDPSNLLLDEILNGLDPAGMAFARNWMLEERRAGRAILLSSHFLSELQTVADRVAFLHDGRVLRTITRSELTSEGAAIVRITFENLDESALEYLRTVGSPRTEGLTVFLAEPRLSPASLNTELVQRGYRISEIRLETTSLEAYFLRLIGSAG